MFPDTFISSDMCEGETHITSDMCLPGRKRQNSNTMYHGYPSYQVAFNIMAARVSEKSLLNLQVFRFIK